MDQRSKSMTCHYEIAKGKHQWHFTRQSHSLTKISWKKTSKAQATKAKSEQDYIINTEAVNKMEENIFRLHNKQRTNIHV